MKRETLKYKIAVIMERANNARTINEKYDIAMTALPLEQELSRLEERSESIKQNVIVCIVGLVLLSLFIATLTFITTI